LENITDLLSLRFYIFLRNIPPSGCMKNTSQLINLMKNTDISSLLPLSTSVERGTEGVR
jgi:hypothetical protein